MAVIGNNNLNYIEVAKRLDPDGKVAQIVEIMSKTNPIIQDAVAVEGNLPTGHRTTVRKGLPSVAWRLLNYGVPKGKSQTVQVDDQCGMLEAYSEVDKKLMELNGNKESFRMSEDRAFIEAMNQASADTLFYGNVAINPERFVGLAPRYSSLSAENARNIIDGGGSGSDNTSIYIVTWGENTAHMIYPKGSKAGIEVEDLGQQTATDAAGGYYEVLRTHYAMNAGFTLRDWRYCARICNIDVSELSDAGESGFNGANLINLLIKAVNSIESMGMGNTVIYANRTVVTALDLLQANKANVQLSTMEYAGQKVTAFRGIPIRQTDAILNTESRVV